VRRSRVREKLAAGKAAIVGAMNSTDPVVCDIIGMTGFDALWMCNEHKGIDWDRMGNLIRTCAMNDMDSMIRVSKGSYNDYVRPLEIGATGIMVPHCMSAAEARSIGQATKFHPIGRRALDSGNADGHYCMVPLAQYLAEANDRTFTVVQIEDPEILDQIDEAVASPGADIFFVGPGDLSHGLGEPGNTKHPSILKAIDDVAAACKKHGKHWGLPVSPESAPRYMEMGARFLACGADVIGLAAYFGDLRKRLSALGIEFSPKV
jgi:4-hydroxy-2-oxoheptanedioate aldolase